MRAITLFAVLFIAIISYADYGTIGADSRNYRILSKVELLQPFGPALEDGTPVSGTNVNVRFGGTVESLSYSGSDFWINAQLKQIDAEILSTGVTGSHSYVFTLDSHPLAESTVGIKLSRFASTHFVDGSSITIRAKCTFHIRRITSQQILEEADVVTPWATIIVQAYNKCQLWSTREDVIGNQYQVDPNALWSNYSQTTNRICSKARQYFPNAPLNHQVLFPQSHVDDPNQHEAANSDSINNKMSQATVWFVATHGEADRIRSSFDDTNVQSPDDQLIASEIAAYTQRSGSAPEPNMAIIYACSTTAVPLLFPNCFRMLGGMSTVDDKAYCGFPRVLWSILNPTPNGVLMGLDSHANVLASDLYNGATIQEALIHAYNRYKPRDEDNNIMEMECWGDGFARLSGVYMSQSEWNPARRFEWVWFMDLH